MKRTMKLKPLENNSCEEAIVIRKLIDCQPVENHVFSLPHPWKGIGEAIIACPRDPHQRSEALNTAISNLPGGDQIFEVVFSAPLDIDEISIGIGGLMSSDEILTSEWKEPIWTIKDILPIGLSIMAGAPKIGKSWLALQVAREVAIGGKVFDRNTVSGSILYMALEDPPRRLQKRMKLQNWPIGVNADFLTLGSFFDNVGDLRVGGSQRLAFQIEKNGCRLVVIDTFSRAISGDQSDVYEMTQWLTPVHKIAHEKNCAVMLVDHHRKRKGFDQDMISDILGSTAKGAMADTIWGLYRERGNSEAKIKL